jgi:2-polyprenyl-3-methyl-5-hydroxy-6-metoxy-1,4-benzoquinol methylase
LSASIPDSRKYPQRIQFYTGEVPELLNVGLEHSDWTSFLDLGCGDGALLQAMYQQGYFDGKHPYAVDMSESRIALVRNISEDIDCWVGDASNTSFQDGSIDFVASTQVIEHVEDDEEMVKEINRILVPNGLAYISTVFKKNYAWYYYRCNGKWTIDPTHVREYTQDGQLLDKLTKHGLEVLRTKKTLTSRPLVDAVLRRMRVKNTIYQTRGLKLLRRLSLPIPGYYNWEILCRKL